MKIKLFALYDKQIRKPLIEKKFLHLRSMSGRTDFDQIMFLQNQDEETFNIIR